jgi:pilus assembly protein Flp/PilA
MSIEEVKTNMLKLYTTLQLALTRVFDEEEGQGLTEYALILFLIAIVAIAALSFLGGQVTKVLNTVGNSI